MQPCVCSDPSLARAAKDHAAQLRDLPEQEHRARCEQLEARVVAVFEEAQSASAGFLRFHRKLDANGAAVIYGLSVQRDAYTKTCLFVRVDAAHARGVRLAFGSRGC
jgi:hypothetical protein